MTDTLPQTPDAGKDMTIAETQGEMALIGVKMLNKGIKGPDAWFKIMANRFSVVLWSGEMSFGTNMHTKSIPGDTPGEAIAAAHDFFDAQPDPETEGERKFTRALADAVDIATEYALPDVMVAPVRAAIVEVNTVLLEGPKP